MQFSGRLEARIDVPTGGAAVSATIPNGAGATAATVPAGSYFMSDDGGLDGLLETLKTKLNETVQGYPVTAAAAAAAFGAGTWTAGYLFNETSGNLAASFGAPSLTPVSTPTYGNAGPIGDVDKAIGFDSVADAFDGGDNFEPGAADDLILAWVGYHAPPADGFANWISKGLGGGGNGRYSVYTSTVAGATQLFFDVTTTAGTTVSTSIGTGTMATIANGWHVGMAVVERASGKIRLGLRSAGVSYLANEAAVPAVSLASAENFLVGAQNVLAPVTLKLSAMYIAKGVGAATGVSAGLSAALAAFEAAVSAAWTVTKSDTTGLVSIGWTGYATPTWSLTWTSTNLRDALGFTANIAGVTTTQTGTQQCRGIWYPDAPLLVRDSDPRLAPVGSDARTSVTPTGEAITLVGNYFREHKGLMWQLIPVDRIREQSATYANASWRTFWDDTQLGRGHSWFVPGAPLLIVDHTGQVLGSDMASTGPTNGWQVVDPSRVEPRRHDPGGWNGLWNLEIAQVIAEDE
jgi:hypothetical protein